MPHTSIAWADGLPEDTLNLLEDYEESISWWGDQQSRLQVLLSLHAVNLK